MGCVLCDRVDHETLLQGPCVPVLYFFVNLPVSFWLRSSGYRYQKTFLGLSMPIRTFLRCRNIQGRIR